MARGKIQGYVERGGNTVTTDGRVSTTNVQKSFPLATVEVFNAGTSTPSTIFSDEGGTPKTNPFTADNDGHWFFWADQGRYDVQFSGAGIPSPFTLFGLETIISTTALNDPGGNGIVVRTSSGVTTFRAIEGTTSAIVVTNGNGVAGNPVINLDTNLSFVGKTVTAGTFVSPAIGNFQNAVHSHADAAGGGQLNATNVFNAGTVPVARLPIMVGASGVSNGVAGLVTQPLIGDENKFLRGDGSWQVTGGGGGTPGSPNLSVQYNNGGAFGGVTGTSSDGTQVTWTAGVLRATSPRITTSIFDTNGNAIITLNALGSAANNFQIANAAAGGHPVLSAVGASADINIVLTPKGAGILDTAGNFRITNNAPQITLVDANDTKTVRMSVNGANWDFTNDTLGSVPIRIDTTNNLITIPGNLTINNSNPTITFDDTAGTDSKIHHDASILRLGSTSVDHISLDVGTGVTTFAQIPVGPASDPTTDNQLPRKKYTDDKSYWAANWFIADPATFPLASFDLAQKALIPKGNWKALTLHAIFNTGSASGSFSVELRKHPFGDQTTETTLGTITFNSGTLGVGQDVDISDHEFTEKDWLYIKLSARSSPLQKNVSISVVGDKLGTI